MWFLQNNLEKTLWAKTRLCVSQALSRYNNFIMAFSCVFCVNILWNPLIPELWVYDSSVRSSCNESWLRFLWFSLFAPPNSLWVLWQSLSKNQVWNWFVFGCAKNSGELWSSVKCPLSSLVALLLYYKGFFKPKTDCFVNCAFGQVKLNGFIVYYPPSYPRADG